jgi:hypothetical protein
MEGQPSDFAPGLRGLPAEERARRLREVFDRIRHRPPDPRYEGKSDAEVVAMIKETRDEIWKEHVANRR